MDTHDLGRDSASSSRWVAVTAGMLLLLVAACGPGGRDGATSPSSGAAQPTASAGATAPALLVFDTKRCRNTGTVKALGAVWELVDPVPIAWRGTGEQQGRLTVVEAENAIFNAIFKAGDGTELRVTTGPHEDVCHGWQDAGG